MDYNNIEVIALTQKLVSIQSTNPGTYEKEIGEFIYDWMSRTGAEVHKDEFAKDRFNVVAHFPGEINDPALIYICHMDVVPTGEGWTYDPWKAEIIDGRMYGRGALDMKSGLAAAMIAFRDIFKSGKKPKHSFTFIASSDEEGNIMEGAEQAVKSGWITKNSWVLDCESTGGKIWFAHKGKTWFKISTHGKPAHGSTPWAGADAIAAMAEVITEIRTSIKSYPEDETFGVPSICFGTLKGGTSTNVVADECTLTIDMRLAPPLTIEASIKLVEDAITAGTGKIKGTTGTYEVIAQKPYIEFNPDSYLWKKLNETCEKVLGSIPETVMFTGYTDSGVVAAVTGNINCMSYGPKGDRLHQADEYVECDSVISTLNVITELIKDILY